MISQAHGRHPSNGKPKRNNQRKDLRFTSVGPDGIRRKQTFKDLMKIEEPLALYYKVQDRWIWQTVVCKKNPPDWAKNYTPASCAYI